MIAIQQPDPVPGYRLLGQIGEGSTCRVHRAQQRSTGQLVAIKILKTRAVPHAFAREQLRSCFERESQLCARLYHPHIVKLLDKGYTHAREPFAVFELVPGETLRDRLLREGALSASLTGELMGQVLDALTTAHAQGIVHRDLKPLNIMISKSGARGHATLLDYGIGALIAGVTQRRASAGACMLGTPRYSAPEQLRGEPPTVSSDLYAWALIVVECLIGRPAVAGTTLAQIYDQQLSATQLPIPAQLTRHPVSTLLQRLLNKEPRARGSAPSAYRDFRSLDLKSLEAQLQTGTAANSGGQLLEHTLPCYPPVVLPIAR